MIKLVEPCPHYFDSYIEAFHAYKKHKVASYAFSDATQINIFDKFDYYKNEDHLPPNRVGAHFCWLVDDEKHYFIGEITIRHRLNAALERYGGHIGYGVRFSEWNKGFGTLMLELALAEAKKLGLREILITCDDQNIGSARVMEKNGFTLGDKVENTFNQETIITRRYRKTIE